MSLHRSKTLPPTPASPFALAAAVAAMLLALVPLTGCSDDHRRLSEKEALDYKRALIRQGELSASQVTEFGSDSRRTRVEIDALYSRMSAESAEQRTKERAYWEDELRREREAAAESSEP